MTKEQKNLYKTSKKAKNNYIKSYLQNFSLKKLFFPDKTKITFVLATIIFCFLVVSFSIHFKDTEIYIAISGILVSILSMIYTFVRLKTNIKNNYMKTISTIFSILVLCFIIIFGCMIYTITK